MTRQQTVTCLARKLLDKVLMSSTSPIRWFPEKGLTALGWLPASASTEASGKRQRSPCLGPGISCPIYLGLTTRIMRICCPSLCQSQRERTSIWKKLGKHPEASLGSGMTSRESSHHHSIPPHPHQVWTPARTSTSPYTTKALNSIRLDAKSILSDPGTFPTRQSPTQRLRGEDEQDVLRGP